MRMFLKWLLSIFYRVEVEGVENWPKNEERLLVISNHLSFLDAVLLACYLPEKLAFSINTHIANRWYIKPFLSLAETYPIDPTNPLATKKLISLVKSGKRLAIFPEGRITVTGSLMKVYEGPALIADKAEASIVQIRIDGAQYSRFSRLKGMIRLRSFPKISLHILPKETLELPEEVKGRKRRQLAGQQLHHMMTEMLFETSDRHRTIYTALLDAVHIHGRSHIILDDMQRNPIHYRQLLMRSHALGSTLESTCRLKQRDRVGLFLPNSQAAVISFLALQRYGVIPAMLNYAAGPTSVASACKAASIKRILTSKRFIEMGKLDDVIAHLKNQKIDIIYLEDIRDSVRTFTKLTALVQSYLPLCLIRKRIEPLQNKPEDASVILFTSGSEGAPKGVVLSHENLMSNMMQLASVIDFGPKDKVFNVLPVFHAFGLTGGMLLPLLNGIHGFHYPSPLHYRIVPELVYDTNATILFGTDTFLRGYARFAHPYDFYAIRYIFAGAEKLQEETRQTYMTRFGKRILEGYGATETAPGLTMNTPMHSKVGSVGKLLPGIRHRLIKQEGIKEGGRLEVSGPNIMLGYYKVDKPGILQPIKPEKGTSWYDTGDIVSLDEEGYVFIQGRAKRFAKIAGEMVSLAAVESLLQTLYPESQHAVIAVKDAKKGEALLLFTTENALTAKKLSTAFKAKGATALMIPKQINTLKALPLLATGKIDYNALKEMAS